MRPAPVPRRLDAAAVAALRAMAADGVSVIAMARRFGVTRWGIEREAVAHGIALPGPRVAAGREPRGSRVGAVAAMLGDAALCERVRRLRIEERRSYDYIGGQLGMSADHLRLLGDALGLPGGYLNRGRTSGHAARVAEAAGAAP